MIYLYELYDTYGTCVYVGITKNPEKRLRHHIHYAKDRRFFGQQLTITVVNIFTDKKEALLAEYNLKVEYKMFTGEREWNRAGGRALKGRIPKNLKSIKKDGGKTASSIIRTCDKCGREIKGPVYFLHIKGCT